MLISGFPIELSWNVANGAAKKIQKELKKHGTAKKIQKELKKMEQGTQETESDVQTAATKIRKGQVCSCYHSSFCEGFSDTNVHMII